MKIAIRADGGSQIGMGHIMRTLVLAKELAKINEVFYICRIDQKDTCKNTNWDFRIENISDKYKKGIEKIISEGFNVCFVRENYLVDDIGKISQYLHQVPSCHSLDVYRRYEEDQVHAVDPIRHPFQCVMLT